MGNKKYSNMFKKNHIKNPIEATSIETEKITTSDNITEYEELTSEEISSLNQEDIITVDINQNFLGTVTGCNKLNVRKEPNSNSSVLCVIDANTEVQIHMNETNEEYYKVTIPSGITGYCMKKYINIKYSIV